ncbi:MAG: MFS transporter [Acholeplasmataceae bacterium]
MTRGKLTTLIISSFWMMLLMGTVYAYSIFRTEVTNTYQLSTFESGLPYMLSLFFYALFMMLTGRILNQKNLRYLVVLGTLLIISGFFISFISTSFILFIFGYGVMIGSGIGIVYGIPLYIIQKSNTVKTGFLTGAVLLGFGLSPLITAPIGKLLLINYGLDQTFLIFSVIFLVTQLPLAFLFKVKFDDKEEPSSNLTLKKLLSKKFIILYILFMLTSSIGLMMIGLSFQVGATYYAFDVHIVTYSLSIFAICNGFARPLFGHLIDKFGLIKPSIISLLLIGIAALLGILNKGQHYGLFLLSYSLFWFNLGAWLSIMPSMVKHLYDHIDYARVYGYLFTAYGLGAILSNLISGSIIDLLGQTTYLYLSILILVSIGLYLVYRLKVVQLTKNYDL